MTPGLLLCVVLFGTALVGCVGGLARDLVLSRGRGRHQADRSAEGLVRAALDRVPVGSLLHAITRLVPRQRRQKPPCPACQGQGFIPECAICHHVLLMESQRAGGEVR